MLFVGKVRFGVSNGEVRDDGCVAIEEQDGTLQAGFIRAMKRRSETGMSPMVYVDKFNVDKFNVDKKHSINLLSTESSSAATVDCPHSIYPLVSQERHHLFQRTN